MIPVIIGVTIIALIAGLMVSNYFGTEGFAVQKGSGPGSDAQYAIDVLNFTEMKELPAKYNSGELKFTPEQLVNRVISLMNYPRDSYYKNHKDEFISPDWPGVMADYFYNVMIPQINPDKRAAVQTSVDWYMNNIIKGKLSPALQGVSTAPIPPAVSTTAPAPAPAPTPAPAPAPAGKIITKGAGPGSDAQYALDVMKFTEMKELPSKYNSGAIADPESLVNRAIQLMNYPRDAYYNANKGEFMSGDWSGVMADYFYNIMLPQIDISKRAALQTKVDFYMKNIIKGKLLPQLQGPNTAPLPPEVSGGAAVAVAPAPVQAPATPSMTIPSPKPEPEIIKTPTVIPIPSDSVTLNPVPRKTTKAIVNSSPPPELTNQTTATASIKGSAPAAAKPSITAKRAKPVITAKPSAAAKPVIPAQPSITTMPSAAQPTPISPTIAITPPITVGSANRFVESVPYRVLSNDDIKKSMDLVLNVLSPNSLADLPVYDEFIKSLPASFTSAVNIYKEDYFTKTNAPTLQFIDTIYRLYKPFESKYYLIAGQSPVILFDRTFKVYMATMANEAKVQLRYIPEQITSLEKALVPWIPPANRNASQPVIGNVSYPAAASPSYFIPQNMTSLADSIRKTIREQLNELKIGAGVGTAPTTGSPSQVSPSLVQGFMDYQRRNKSGCPNCYPTPWTPDNIPFNPNDYIRKDKIPCAQCRIP